MPSTKPLYQSSNTSSPFIPTKISHTTSVVSSSLSLMLLIIIGINTCGTNEDDIKKNINRGNRTDNNLRDILVINYVSIHETLFPFENIGTVSKIHVSVYCACNYNYL